MSDLVSIDERVEKILGELREQLFQKGVKGLSGLAKTFKIADYDNSGLLDSGEFEEALSYAGLFLKQGDISMLFKYFDKDGNGGITYQEFVGSMAQPLNERRRSVVQKAFMKMDVDGSGMISKREVARVFTASSHPDVLKGEKTPDQVLNEFIQGFEGNGGDGQISAQEWMAFYRDLSASVPSDDYFMAMMEGVWRVQEDGAPDKFDMQISKLCEILKEKVRQKTKNGRDERMTLRNAFNHFDNDESGEVTKQEFKQSMQMFGIVLKSKELKAFFNKFDTNGSGTISSQEFIALLYKGGK